MYGCFTDSSNKLYINASYINTGILTVQNGSYTLFKADINNKTVDIAAFSVSGNSIVGSSIGMCGKSGENWAFWAGSNTSGEAPFRVGHAGELIASNATINGVINASSGKIGDFNIGTGSDGLWTDDMKIVYDHLEFYIDGYTVGLTTTNTINAATERFKRGLWVDGGLNIGGNLQLSTGNSIYISSYRAISSYSNVFHMDGTNKTLTFINGLLVSVE